MQPEQFEKLQPHELNQLIDGYKWRQQNDEEMFAYFTCCLVNPQLKKPTSPQKILEPLRKKRKEVASAQNDTQALKAEFAEALKEYGVGEEVNSCQR